MQKMSRDEINQILAPMKIIALDDYKSTKTISTYKCLVCDKEFKTQYNSLSKSNYCGCYECQKIERDKDRSIKTANRRLNNVLLKKSEHVQIVSHDDMCEKFKCKCLICGEEYNANLSSLVKGCFHRKCSIAMSNKLRARSAEEFAEKVGLINKSINIRYIDRTKDPYRAYCVCNICGNMWNTVAHHLLEGRGCPKCGAEKARQSRVKDISEYAAILKDLNLTLISEYDCARNEAELECNICGKHFRTSLTHIKRDKFGCPDCCNHKSKMERATKHYLDQHNIEYEEQKRFDGLVGLNNGKLSFDFYLPSFNLLIECQGVQHEHPIIRFGGDKQFEKQLEHDQRKKDFANKLKIKLLEIWYYDFKNINEILDTNLYVA